jgi:hypothetical protein
MPTKHPRHPVTEADEGAQVVEGVDDRDRKRLEAIKQTAGSLSGVYDTHYLKQLREDWSD